MSSTTKLEVIVLVFDGFEPLDLFGPIELLSFLDEVRFRYVSEFGGRIKNKVGLNLDTEKMSPGESCDILLIPGGQGTRSIYLQPSFIDYVKSYAENASYVLSVCTGAVLLSETGLLNGRRATSNKRSFDWVSSTNAKVDWVRQARWVVDGKYYTSSGVSAGMDMVLGFISDQFGLSKAKDIAHKIEYHWQSDSTKDDFA
ncbi:DJ-1/PfpI family protein [Streptococcus orisratti]|uniref:DJ-1/PfpI family protein n=1 Tax=Streptococcus TaxID=1301 RepID=UPI0003723D39|nr:DJ-1/PfpI family protein [Streptococcus orisratti]